MASSAEDRPDDDNNLYIQLSDTGSIALVLLREATILTRTDETLLRNCACQALKIVQLCC